MKATMIGYVLGALCAVCALAGMAVAQERAAEARRIDILAASGYPPFADRSLPGGGLLTEIVEAAMQAAAPEGGYRIHWVDDRAAHLDPLLSEGLLELGFAWDCEAAGARACEGFAVSAPLMEVLTLLYVPQGSALRVEGRAGVTGARLCRPQGFSVAMLDAGGRDWLKSGAVALRRPATAAACFELMEAGEVEAVVLDEFLGRHLIRQMGLTDRVTADPMRPVSVDALRVVAHGAYPEALAALAEFERGFALIRANGGYAALLEAHLERHWAGE